MHIIIRPMLLTPKIRFHCNATCIVSIDTGQRQRCWLLPPVGASLSHKSSIAPEKALKGKENHLLRVYNSQRVEDYNRKQSGLKYAGQLADVSKFRYTYYSMRCAHYGDPRPRSKGIRPVQRCFAMGCQAKITLSYSRLPDSGDSQ